MAWLRGHAAGWFGRALAIGSLAAAVLLAGFAISRLDRRPRSQDAFLYAYSTGLVPEVSGRIIAVHVRENQRVTKDEIVVEIEREPYELHLAQARADVAALRAQIDVSSRQIASQSTAARAAATEIQGAMSQLDLAKATAARLSPLVDKGYTTPQQFDEAQTNEKVAQTSLTAAAQKAKEATQAVGDTESLRGARVRARLPRPEDELERDSETRKDPAAGRLTHGPATGGGVRICSIGASVGTTTP